jgi:6-phosphogluconolactonase (cycloisomerase 2 family)
MPTRRFLLKATPALLGSSSWLGAQLPAKNPPLMAYVGTYSFPKPFMRGGQMMLPPGNGRGIHLFHVDRETGALSPAGLHAQNTSPTCLTFNAAQSCLYSSNATAVMEDGDSGSVSAFAIDPGTGQLKLLNTVSSGGSGPTYVSVHPSGKFLLVANYFGGSVAVLPIEPDGSLGAATDVKNGTGKVGPKKATSAPSGSFAISGHEGPHAHMIQTDPSGRYVLSADLGTDQILVWKLDEQKGVLTPNDPASASLPPGDGPRHFAFHPAGRWLYSLQEEASTLVVFDFDPANGRLVSRQTISSMPPGFAGSSLASEILVSPDGRFVYAASRLHDSISIFAIGKDGTLTYVDEAWTHGDFPRTFSFDPSGKLLYSCNQRGDNIATFRVDRDTGKLAFTGQFTPVGSPAIIVFR